MSIIRCPFHLLHSQLRMMRSFAVIASVSAVAIAASHVGCFIAAAEESERAVTLEILPFERATNPVFSIGVEHIPSVISQDFDITDERIATVQLALPGLLAAALMPYQHVQLIALAGRPATREFKTTDKPGSYSKTSEAPVALAEFFVRGFVAIRSNEVIVESVLNNRATGRSRRLNSTSIHIDRLNAGIEPLAFVIANEIAKQKGVKFTPRSIIVTCAHDSEMPRASELERVLQQNVTSLVRTLTLDSGAKRINWLNSNQKDCSSLTSLQELAKQERADAVVAFSLQPSNQQKAAGVVGIKWAMEIMGDGKRIPMPDISLEPTKLVLDNNEVTREIVSLLNAITTVTGDWRILEVPGAQEGARAYLEFGKKASGNRSGSAVRSAAVQDYFFTMAVSRANELTTAEASEAKFHLASIRLRQGRSNEAAVLLNEAASQDQENFDIRLAQAELSFQRGKYEEAKERYRDIIRRFPNRAEAYERLAIALTLRGEDEGAAQVYRGLKAAIPDSLVAYRGLAKISLAKGNWLSAETWNEAASFLEDGIGKLSDEVQQLQLKQELAILYADAGRAYYVKGDYRTALEFYDKSIVRNPSVRAHFYRALTHYKEPRDVDRALDDYSAVISLTELEYLPSFTPEYIGSKLGVLEILTLRGDLANAISRAEETLMLFTANKELISFEPVVRLIKLAAKIAGNIPSYRLDADELRIVADNIPRRYTYGSFFWEFGDIDQFVADQVGVPENLKCLYKQISHSVQNLLPVVCKLT